MNNMTDRVHLAKILLGYFGLSSVSADHVSHRDFPELNAIVRSVVLGGCSAFLMTFKRDHLCFSAFFVCHIGLLFYGTVDEDVLSALASKNVTQEKLIVAVKARLEG